MQVHNLRLQSRQCLVQRPAVLKVHLRTVPGDNDGLINHCRCPTDITSQPGGKVSRKAAAANNAAPSLSKALNNRQAASSPPLA